MGKTTVVPKKGARGLQWRIWLVSDKGDSGLPPCPHQNEHQQNTRYFSFLQAALGSRYIRLYSECVVLVSTECNLGFIVLICGGTDWSVEQFIFNSGRGLGEYPAAQGAHVLYDHLG